MKRMKILVLAAAAQVCVWASIAGELGALLLQRSVGQVQAAGGSGGANVDVPPAPPRLDSRDASPVDSEEDRSLSAAVELAQTAGTEMERQIFDIITPALNIRASAEGDIIRRVDIAGPPIRILVIRQRPGVEAIDVILTHGVRENGTLKMHFYATSTDGRLARVIYKENRQPPRNIPLNRAAGPFRTEVDFWRDWERDYQKEMMDGDK